MSSRLSEFTTFGIGGPAERIEIVRSRSRLEEIAHLGLILGRGSNVLVSDDGYDGVVAINRYESISMRGTVLDVGSGTRLSAVCGYAAENGLSGMEWAIGIPGSVGGAVVMNAGAFGGSMSDIIEYADVLRGDRTVRLSADELGFGYRKSALSKSDTVLSCAVRLRRGDRAHIKRSQRLYASIRAQKQPRGKSAGSVFVNPPGISVGKLFDEAGLKGLRRGGAIISDRHANIIVNIDGATARDVCGLIAVMKEVLLKNNVAAKEEIIYVGGF